MIRSFRFVAALVCSNILSSASPHIQNADSSEAQKLTARALALADLYNWADAAPFFQQAQMLFERTGDKRNALHARLGFIRANIERQQETLPAVSNDLKIELEDNPLLQSDRRLRLFAFIVKGDIDTETDTAAMRDDWRQVQALAQEFGEAKWGYRALAQLGIAAFYDGDTETARRSAGEALALAKEAKDVGAQIRILTILGRGLVATKAFGQSLPLLENALLLAGTVPDSGFQFTAQGVRIEALIGLKQYERAQQLTDETLNAARRDGRMAHEATVLGLAARIAAASGNATNALTILDSAISKGEQIGLVRVLAQFYALAAEINRQLGNLASAEEHLAKAAHATQVSGDIWAVPQRLLMLADLRRARGQYKEADEVYERAEMFVDAMIGKASTVFEKSALIRSASELYTKHISLVADHFKDPEKVYGIIEQVRGRIAADQLAVGTVASPEARRTEREIARLRLKLMKAHSTSEIRELRDNIFFSEQARWVAPGVSILKRRSSSPVSLDVVKRSLAPETTVLEYVAAEPSSYCLVITRTDVRIVPLVGKLRLEKLASSYLTKVKARQTGMQESKSLYEELIRPLNLRKASRIVVIRDGPLHLLPFDAFRQPDGRYLVQRSIVTYAPSVTSHHLLTQETVTGRSRALLGVGGVGYGRSGMNTAGLARGGRALSVFRTSILD